MRCTGISIQPAKYRRLYNLDDALVARPSLSVDESATPERNFSLPGQFLHKIEERVGRTMFTVVGLTLDDVWSGALPQMRLGKALEERKKPEDLRAGRAQKIVIYSTDPSNTQGFSERTKYKDRGNFVTVLYFNEAAVAACNQCNIPLRILDHLEEHALPASKVVAFEHPAAPVMPVMKG